MRRLSQVGVMSIYWPRNIAFFFALSLAACLGGQVQDRYASVVEVNLASPSIDPEQPFADPERALGPPDGRTVAVGRGGTLILRFFRGIPNGRGPDLRVVE